MDSGNDRKWCLPVDLSVSTSQQDGVAVVTVSGEVDVYTAAKLRAALDEEIVCTQDRVLRVFRITGLDTVIGIHDTLEDALSS